MARQTSTTMPFTVGLVTQIVGHAGKLSYGNGDTLINKYRVPYEGGFML